MAKAAARKRKRKAPPVTLDMPKSLGGRPRIVLTAEQSRQLDELARIGCTHEEIAGVMAISADTLVRRFAERIKAQRENGRSSLRHAQWQAALGGNPTMLIWLGKNELGQTDKTVTDHAGDIVIRVVREAVRPDAL